MAKLRVVKIDRTPPSHFNPDRPMSDLQRSQVTQAQRELRNWFAEYINIDPRHIRTEQEAADYLAKVTRVLHPESVTAKALPPGRAAKSGAWLGEPKLTKSKKAGKYRAVPSNMRSAKR